MWQLLLKFVTEVSLKPSCHRLPEMLKDWSLNSRWECQAKSNALLIVDYATQVRSQGGFDQTPFCNILSLMCSQIHWMVWIEDLVSVSTIIPLVSFHYWHVIFTGGCNSSTYEPTVANPRANWTPLHESLVTCLLQLLIRQTWSSYSV